MLAKLVPCTLALCFVACAAPPAEHDRLPQQNDDVVLANTDARSLELARATLDAMGGKDAWEATRVIRWRFFGGRLHFWDKQTGDIRIESPERKDDGEVVQPEILVLMNVLTKQGRAWEAGEPVEDPARLAELLQLGHEWWINDAYWMFMPYKLLDPGVTLAYAGEREMEDGRMADVVDMTFDRVGYTPENRYEIFIARDTGLVEQWAFFAEAGQTEPRFTMPWQGWQRFGDIMLATGRGREMDWEIAVLDTADPNLFTEARR